MLGYLMPPREAMKNFLFALFWRGKVNLSYFSAQSALVEATRAVVHLKGEREDRLYGAVHIVLKAESICPCSRFGGFETLTSVAHFSQAPVLCFETGIGAPCPSWVEL